MFLVWCFGMRRLRRRVLECENDAFVRKTFTCKTYGKGINDSVDHSRNVKNA
jgi:hypothetical protein